MSNYFSLTRSRMWRTRAATALAAAGALVLGSGLVMLSAHTATAASGNENKFFVCKYVGQPDVGDPAHHVISVDDSSLEEGEWFKDGQAFSFVLEADDGQVEPAVSECPTYNPPGGPEVVVPDVDVFDQCGTANDSYDVTNDEVNGITQFFWSASPITGGVQLTFTAASGYEISGSDTFDVVWTNVACPTESIAPTVSFQDPTCANPDRTTWSADLTDIVDYTLSDTPGRGKNITVTANIKPALADEFVFADGFDNTIEHSYPTLKDLGCVLGEETTRPKPKPDDEPTVLGTQASAPTAVAAGLSVLPGTGSSSSSLLAQLMVGGGLLLLLAGGWLGFGRREYGAHQA